MEDCVRRRVNVVATVIARIRRTTHDAMVLGILLALVAKHSAVRVEVPKQPFQTGHVIRKLAVEVLFRVGRHFRFAIHGLTFYPITYHYGIPTVKG
jgi:hypothetical protein